MSGARETVGVAAAMAPAEEILADVKGLAQDI